MNLPMIGAPDVPKDMPKALEYSLRACELGHYPACVNAARMLDIGKREKERECVCVCMCVLPRSHSPVWFSGDGVPQDKKRAAELKKRAFDLKFGPPDAQ